MKRSPCLLVIAIASIYMTSACTTEFPFPFSVPVPVPDPVLVTAQEITANYTSFTILPNGKYEFVSESIVNASHWRFDMRFYKDGSELTSDRVVPYVTMSYDDGISTFLYDGVSVSNKVDISWLKFGFKNIDADRIDVRIKGGDSTPLVSTVNNQLICTSGNDTLHVSPVGVGCSEPNIDIEDCVDAESKFGLVPDLGTDQTDAFTRMLNSDETHIFIKEGEYLINGHIRIEAGKEKKVLGGGNTVIKHTIDANDTKGIYSHSALHLEHLIFDYNNGPCARGLLFYENCGTIILQHLTFRNIYDLDVNELGTIVLAIAASGNTIHMDGITLKDMLECGDDIIGTSSGNLTGIYLYEYPTSAAINGYIRNVTIDNIHNINEDGDIIMDDVSCIYMISGAELSDARIEVSKVRAINYGKRAIKVHCNGYVIDDVVGHSDTYEALSLIGVNDGSGSINNATVTGYANAGIAINGTHVKCTNIISRVKRSPLFEDAFPFFVSPMGEDITVDGFDFSGERVLFQNPNTDPDAKIMTDITFRNGIMKSSRHAGFQFNARTRGFKNLEFENVKVEQITGSEANAVFLDCSSLDWSPISESLIMTACTMKNSGSDTEGMVLKYIDGIAIDDLTVESGGSYKNVISLTSCYNGIISGLTNDATVGNLVYQSRCKNIDISDL